MSHTVKGLPSDATSCVSSAGGDMTPGVKENDDVDHASSYSPPPSSADDGFYYDATGMQGYNEGFMYMLPAFQPYAYNAYNPYPNLTLGVDGQYVDTSAFIPSGYCPNTLAYGDLASPYHWDSSFLGNVYTVIPEMPTSIYNMPSSPSPKSVPLYSELSNSYSTQRKASSPSPHAHFKSTTKASQNVSALQSHVLGKNYFAKYPLSNPGKGSVFYSNKQAKVNTQDSDGDEKPKTNGHVDSVGDLGLVGSRRTDDKSSGNDDAVPPQDIIDGNKKTIIKKDQFNLSDFPTKYDHAYFFVIKSYSEDDIHKSIKYNVWASTPNGNKRLDSAYEEAQNRKAVKGSKCPVFLFFSVNASGQFCGVAEMIGRVDFNKNMEFWQQDKWNGFFPVQWHIIKDVPNPQLRHIVLENNDNKPVTNSRDTQEVRFPQGTEMLNIFKNYASKTSILDDFEFYESRQKVMQEKRIRSLVPNFNFLQKTDELTSSLKSVTLSAEKKIDEACKE